MEDKSMTDTDSSRSSTLNGSELNMSTEKSTTDLSRQKTLEDIEANIQVFPGPVLGPSHEPIRTIPSRAAKNEQSVIANTFSRTLSRIRTSDTLDPGPPPDGGARAWSQAVLAHLVCFNTWGFINSFGLFQTYYVSTMGIGSQSDVAWIGSIQVWILFGIGVFSGRALDAGYFKIVFILGSIISLLGMFMLSLSTKYYQVFLSQGICIGVGFGLIFVPSIALTSTYFLKNRSVALGIVVTGSATGGLVFPAIAEQMLPSAGFPWTVRVMAFVQMFGAVMCALFMKPRLPPRKTGPVVEWRAFKETPFSLYLTGAFFFFWAVYIGFFYVGSFGRTIIGISESTSIQLLLVMNGVGVVGRFATNYIAGKLGPINLLLPAVLATALMGYAWTAVNSVTGLWAFTTVYGITAAAIQGLFPVVLTSLTTDQKKAGVRAGMGFAVVGNAVLTGPAIAGALIEQMNGSFLACQIFAGTSMIISAVFLTATRWAVLRKRGEGWSWTVKV